MISREQVLAIGKSRPRMQEVTVPDWPAPALVRVMCSTDRDSFEAENYVTDLNGAKPRVTYSTRNIRARLVVRCLCDAEGKRLFLDQEAALLGQLDGLSLDAIYEACRELNHLTTKSEEDLAKNLEAGQNSSSGSDSPATSS